MADAICYYRLDLSDELKATGYDADDVRRLINAYLDKFNARGGESDWSGGGNPHRMMEEDERDRAIAYFKDACEKLGVSYDEGDDAVSLARDILSECGRDWSYQSGPGGSTYLG